MNDLSDEYLESEIFRVCEAIEQWAKSKDLWFDSGFSPYLEHVGGEPSSLPVVTLLWSEGDLRDVLCGEDAAGLEPEFSDLLEMLGYFYECRDNVTVEIYPESDRLSKAFEGFFHWQWVCGLVKEDTSDVYEEIYSYFIGRPEDLHRLHWRDFEILLFRIFQNHGFKAVLGPGQGDGGVDLRLWHEDPIGDVLTVVQAKKYAPHRTIDQTAVAALFGVSIVEDSQKALFVTTSDYQPVAKKFASRTSGVLELAGKEDVINWCQRAAQGVIEDKSSILEIQNIRKIISQVYNKNDPRVVHATWGYNMTHNNFALVVKESKHAALLMGLKNQVLSDDGYGQRGMEIPRFEINTIQDLLIADNVWRAKRMEKDGRITYWDGKYLFSPWDGRPSIFNYMD